MAEESVKRTTAIDEAEVVSATVKDVPEAEQDHLPVAGSPSTESPVKEPAMETKSVVEASVDEKQVVEDDNDVNDDINDDVNDDNQSFPNNEMKALSELKKLLEDSIANHEFDFATATATAPSLPLVEQLAEGTEESTIDVKSEEWKSKSEEHKTEEEDGTKTVEAIEETVVSVFPPSIPTDNVTAGEVTFTSSDDATAGEGETTMACPSPSDEVLLWGVPLLKDERTDVILLKFLLARDFKVKDAFAMLKNTLKWRKEFDIDGLLEEDLGLGDDVEERAAFMQGVTKDGHPVCYNVYGVFQDKGVYQRMFSDQEKRDRFIRWRIQVLEKSVRKLDFRSGGICTILQVNDLNDSPGPGKWELRQATKQALHLLQDNYPEFVAKQVFINVPWWYVAVNKMISPFLTQRTKSKFVIAGPSKSAETLFNYISPEQVPIEYGGLSKQGEVFGTKDGANQIMVKPTSKETVEFAVTEACNLTWEVRVVGWEVRYGAEFVPNAKDGYTVIIQKMRKVSPTEETIITNCFKSSEPGKLLFTIHNSSSKKKRLLYRLKSIPLPF